MYLIVITLTSVGYGDMVAKSLWGRSLIMVTSIWGAFLISLTILTVANVFALNNVQKKAMNDIHVTQKATRSISLGIKYFL